MFILKLFRKNNPRNKLKSCLKFLLILSLVLSICKLFLGSKSQLNRTEKININNLKIISEESLVREIKNVNKIIPLEVELSQTITIDKSWGDFDVFKKFKQIKFFANCSYSVDLSQITTEDIDINENKLSINLPNPQIFSINIDRDKTIFEDSSNGLFRFGEIKLTSEEFEIIQDEVCKSFEETMKNDEMYNKVVSSTKLSLEKLVEQITLEKMKINVSFK